jgi:hypothetical protein
VDEPVAVGVDAGRRLVRSRIGLPGAAEVHADGRVPVVADLHARRLGRVATTPAEGDAGDAHHDEEDDDEGEPEVALPGLRVDGTLLAGGFAHGGTGYPRGRSKRPARSGQV